MEEKNYRVLRIEEQLYGCEELPEGQPVLCDVLLEAADGTLLTNTPATELVVENGAVVGVKAEGEGKAYTIRAKAVILASGG